MNGECLVSVRALHRRYGSVHAVRGISFDVGRGEVLGLLGPNGAGKTSTMQMLCGALAPSSGEILVGGENLMQRPGAAKKRIGYLPELPPLYPELSVDEFLSFCARLRKVAPGDRAAAVAGARNRCGLDRVGRRLIGNLSKGFRQRVGVAQAIVHAPEVVVLDEPTSGLDPNQLREIRDLIRELGRDHAVILSTHILAEVQAVCQRVQILNEGRIVLNERLDALDGREPGLRAAFRLPPDAAILERLEGVTRVERVDAQRLRILHRPGSAVAEELVRRSAASGWDLYELVPEQGTLEEIFVALTHGEAGVAADVGQAT